MLCCVDMLMNCVDDDDDDDKMMLCCDSTVEQLCLADLLPSVLNDRVWLVDCRQEHVTAGETQVDNH